METCFMICETLAYLASLDIIAYLLAPCVLALLLGMAFYFFK